MADERREAGYARQGGVADHIPRWYSDPRVVQIMCAVSDAERHQEDSNLNERTGRHEDMQLNSSFGELTAKGPENRIGIETMVTNAIARAVAKMLFIDIADVDPTQTVAGYGIDSLIAGMIVDSALGT